MEDLEMHALKMSPCKPKMWVRYVDDVFAIWPHGDHLLEAFHWHLNAQNPSSQYTMDRELEGFLVPLAAQATFPLPFLSDLLSTSPYIPPLLIHSP